MKGTRNVGMAGPPGTAGRAVDVLIDGFPAAGHISGVDVVLVIMGMADHDVGLAETGQQVQDVRIMLVFVDIGTGCGSTGAEGDVGAEDYELVLLVGDQFDILLEPLELGVGKAAVVFPGGSVRLGGGTLGRNHDIIHHDDMGVSAVERVVGRTALLEELVRSIVIVQVSGGVGKGGVMVVVADALEEGQVTSVDLDVGHGLHHHVPGGVGVERDVTQRNSIHIRILG